MIEVRAEKSYKDLQRFKEENRKRNQQLNHKQALMQQKNQERLDEIKRREEREVVKRDKILGNKKKLDQ